MPTVLMIGSDLHLLEVRKLLLQHTGCRVLTEASISALETVSEPLDLLILCHTLPQDESRTAVRLADARWPLLPKLVLLSWHDYSLPGNQVNRFYIVDGPERLLARVQQLIPIHQQCAA